MKVGSPNPATRMRARLIRKCGDYFANSNQKSRLPLAIAWLGVFDGPQTGQPLASYNSEISLREYCFCTAPVICLGVLLRCLISAKKRDLYGICLTSMCTHDLAISVLSCGRSSQQNCTESSVCGLPHTFRPKDSEDGSPEQVASELLQISM